MKNEVKQFLKWAFLKMDLMDTKDHYNYMLMKMISLDEGVCTGPYTDTRGNLTIGIGRNLTGTNLSYSEISVLFINDIQHLLVLLANSVSLKEIWFDLSTIRRSALINMAFNLGFNKFMTFEKMLKALINKDYISAADEIRDSKYWRDNDTHARAERIARMIETDKIDIYYEIA